jgi:hypothetical protein
MRIRADQHPSSVGMAFSYRRLRQRVVRMHKVVTDETQPKQYVSLQMTLLAVFIRQNIKEFTGFHL